MDDLKNINVVNLYDIKIIVFDSDMIFKNLVNTYSDHFTCLHLMYIFKLF